jgi:hypothetical protein
LATKCIFSLSAGPSYYHIQGNSPVIMSLTKFMMQPTIHVPHCFLVCVFIDYST